MLRNAEGSIQIPGCQGLHVVPQINGIEAALLKRVPERGYIVIAERQNAVFHFVLGNLLHSKSPLLVSFSDSMEPFLPRTGVQLSRSESQMVRLRARPDHPAHSAIM